MGPIDCEVRRRSGRPHWTRSVFYCCHEGVPAAIGQAMPERGRTAFDELTMDAMSLISKFENHMIPEGGKEQYEGRIRLVDYILEKKPVTESGCRYCPHCLKETPTVFAICLACWTALESHGLKPYRIIEEEDEEETTKRQIDEEVRRHKETIFKDVVNEAKEGAA